MALALAAANEISLAMTTTALSSEVMEDTASNCARQAPALDE